MTTATNNETFAFAAALAKTAVSRVKSIRIEWSESNTFAGVEGETMSVERAEAMAIACMHERNEYNAANDADGGYFKTKFVMTFENENTHEGRIDFDGSRQSFVMHVLDFYRHTVQSDAPYVTDENRAACAENLAYLLGE